MAFLPNRFREPGGANADMTLIQYLEDAYTKSVWPVPKYISFCRKALEAGYRVKLYEAQRTVSKYVTVRYHKYTYKVRFSNHKPLLEREKQKDCNFFVGITNLRTTTSDMAWAAMTKFFEERKKNEKTSEARKETE
jgi:hypothetical protein